MKNGKAHDFIIPESEQCETAILGAILLDNHTFNQAASVLQVSDFCRSSHRTLYTRMCDLIAAGKPIDFNTLAEELLRHKELDGIGGVIYLTGLTDGLPRVKNISDYVDIVREKSRSRMLMNLATLISAQLSERDTADEILEGVQEQIIQIVHHGRVGKISSMADIVRDALNELETISRMQGICIGMETGLPMLNEFTTGFRGGEFYVMGARPGQGKTAWMCQSIRANAKKGRKCGVFSIEVPKNQIFYRLACMETGLTIRDTRDPRQLTMVEKRLLAEAGAEIAEWPILIDDNPRMNLKQLQAVARLHIAQGSEIEYVDFLQKIRHPGRSEYDKVTAIADGLWELGRSTGIPVVALSQLKRTEEAPTLSDFRSSGEIEQNANAAMAIWRPKEPDAAHEGNMRHTGQDQILILKQRSGIADVHVPVKFNGEVGIFEERGH